MRKFVNTLFWTVLLLSLGFLMIKMFSGTINESLISEVELKDGLEIKVEYNSINSENKAVFGYLVPYDIVWRTGSKEATVVTFSKDVLFGGKEVKAGSYSIWTVPSIAQWKIILNKEAGQYGTSYDASKDLLSVSAVPVTVEENQSDLRLNLSPIEENTASLNLRWEKISVSVPIERILSKP